MKKLLLVLVLVSVGSVMADNPYRRPKRVDTNPITGKPLQMPNGPYRNACENCYFEYRSEDLYLCCTCTNKKGDKEKLEVEIRSMGSVYDQELRVYYIDLDDSDQKKEYSKRIEFFPAYGGYKSYSPIERRDNNERRFLWVDELGVTKTKMAIKPTGN